MKHLLIIILFLVSCSSSWLTVVVKGEKEKDSWVERLKTENKSYRVYTLSDDFYEIKYKDK